jgi:uncharacterized protein (UPF0262 family)
MIALAERLLSVDIDETSIGYGMPVQASERGAAIADLVDHGSFRLSGSDGPYRLRLSRDGGKLVLDIRDAEGAPRMVHVLSITPLRRVVRDYFLICESYLGALREGQHDRVQTIDMARRGVHNEGADLLRERLAGKAEVDHDTARMLFTLVSSLAWTGREGG